ncbi:hypothetical protein CAPTEDRAFT_150682 [Capitella teleta]|uniref:Complex III subunit 9 n=1 Tax=Capitella teleta TaxID=283909 RepID=R7V4F7_CAPTE|nr:hypothetical protein CAPTEDRAFT_150682 [Capitella teleta]|eukprot:ELU13713.1 hypothetical protein CAPTEDRAFT_150682 [Capitella teleta]
MSLVSVVYKSVFRRSSTFALAIVAGAFGFERIFDPTCDAVFAYINRGKLYDDCKATFAAQGGAEEE